MKRFLAWVLRIACFAIIGAAVYTLVGCLMHINDDHSAAAIMGTNTTQSFQSSDHSEDAVVEMPQTTGVVEEAVDENPTIIVYSDGQITANRPYCTVTAAFGNIVSSIVAELNWYVDGELVEQETERLLVEGSTVSLQVKLDVEKAAADSAQVLLEVAFDEKVVTGETQVTLERPESDEPTVVIQTTEIPVTAERKTNVYASDQLENKTASMSKGDTGLFLAYESDNGGLRAIQLLLSDGSIGWVDADDVEISEDDYTTDEDYPDEAKMEFVNSMQYDSQTSYMVWVSLYTQKVNVFSGYQKNWELVKSFDCATGLNTSPTTTGVFTYSTQKERWDLGTTYVEPVLIFNGGEAFTSRPYDTETDKIADDTMGEPASGGSVRMMEDDLQWMADHLPQGSLVVVY